MDVSGIVFAGGLGMRLGGTKKALLDVGGKPAIERVLAALGPITDDLIVVDNDDSLAYLPGVRIVPDAQPRAGVLVALASGLAAAHGDLCIVTACDMPFLNGALLRWQVGLAEGFDVVIPVIDGRMEPMHAVYRRETCLVAIQRALARGEKRMTSYLSETRVREIAESELRRIDPDLRSVFNVNTQADLDEARAVAVRHDQ